MLTDKYHEDSSIQHSCVKPFATLLPKGRESPENKGDQHAAENRLADPLILLSQLR